jgi:hypothetical protein
MAVNLSPIFNGWQGFTSTGLPLAGGKINTYAAGTSTPTATYTDSTGGTPNANPIILDATGRLANEIWLTQGTAYKFTLTDSLNNLIGTYDNIVAPIGMVELLAYEALVASNANNTSGAGVVGYAVNNAYSFGTVGYKLNQLVSVFNWFNAAQINDVQSRTASIDVTGALQTAFNAFGGFSVELEIPDGTYLISGSGTRILELAHGVKLKGKSLEGTRFKVAPGSTALYVMEDDGSAAKIELQNLYIDCNNNVNLTRGIRLGRRTTEFGTYGNIDNVMVANCANSGFTAYDIDGNVVTCGTIYTLFCSGAGLVSAAAGSGTKFANFTPLGYTTIGLQQAQADSVQFMEGEAPGADTAITIAGERGLNVGSLILSVPLNRQLRTPIYVNPTYVSDYYLGPTTVFSADSWVTSKIGDLTNPDESGTATGGSVGGPGTLIDTAKNWTVDQWTGAYIKITGGTGSSNVPQRIQSNTSNTITVTGSWTAPDATSTYKISYFIRKSTDGGSTFSGGYPHSNSLSAYWPAFYNLSVSNQVRCQSLVSGLHGNGSPAPTISSSNTIAPTTPVCFVSGATTVKTITVPSAISTAGGGEIKIIPSAGATWVTDTTGNIALASTAVALKTLIMTYDSTTGKWYPSY